MPTLLIVEDGYEYLDFFRLFLEAEHTYHHARSCAEALAQLDIRTVDLIVLDMRFDRSAPSELLGEVDRVAQDYFGGDPVKAQRYVTDNQGTLILAELRAREHRHPVLFISDLPLRKLDNLRELYGQVRAVRSFDAAAIRREIDAALEQGT